MQKLNLGIKRIFRTFAIAFRGTGCFRRANKSAVSNPNNQYKEGDEGGIEHLVKGIEKPITAKKGRVVTSLSRLRRKNRISG
jgi:hypothetical protein